MLSSFVPFLAVAGVANALDIPGLLSSLAPAPVTDPRFHNWQAPGANDLRSACPGLNAAANHGFINHNGRDLTVPDIIQGLAASMNIGADFAAFTAAGGLLTTPNPLGGSFTLQDINKHNFPIEYDASISRGDEYFGNDYSFNQQNFDQYMSAFGADSKTSITTLAAAKHLRYQDSLTRNPQFTHGPREFVLSYGNSALSTQAMSDTTSGAARVDYLRYFFEQEKFPVELGWAPSAQPITLQTLGNMLLEIYLAGPEPLPEGLKMTADSYKDALAALVGGEALLANLTDGISTQLGL